MRPLPSSSMRPGARVRLGAVLFGVIAALFLAWTGAPVAAQDSGEEPAFWSGELPSVAAVDARGEAVSVAVMTERNDVPAAEIEATEAGNPVTVTGVASAATAELPIEVVYVIDVDNRLATDGTLARVGRTVVGDLAGTPPNVKVGVVTAGRQPEIRVPLTNSLDRLERSLYDLRAERSATLLDALGEARTVFSDGDGVTRSIILVSGGSDIGSSASADGVGAALARDGIQLISVGVGDGGQFAKVAGITGGVDHRAADTDDLVAALGRAKALAADRLVVSLDTTAAPASRSDLSLDLSGDRVAASFGGGVFTVSRIQLAPPVVAAPDDTGIWGSRPVLYLSVVLAFATIVMAVWALGSMFVTGSGEIDARIASYTEEPAAAGHSNEDAIVQSSLVRRAVDLTEAVAKDRGVLERIEHALERADVPIRPGEALFFLAAASVLATALVWAVSRSILMGIVFGLLTVGAGYAGLNLRARRRRRKFEDQLPDTLTMLASTLRAGYSLPQGLNAVADEIADPMGVELRRAMTENQLGRDVDESLAGVAERMESPDFAWAVMAIGIQRDVGGNLNELLTTVAETMIERHRLHREVNALTAEGRVSAGILSFMPPGLGLVLWIMNPAYVNTLFSETVGLIMLGAAIVSGVAGLLWMKKVITIDV